MIGKLARVTQQIEQDLSDFGYVRAHRSEVVCYAHVNRVAVFRRRRLQRANHFGDQRRHFEVLEVQAHLSSLDLREVQNVVDERQ